MMLRRNKGTNSTVPATRSTVLSVASRRRPSRIDILRRLAVAGVLICALLLRLRGIDSRPMTVDEAESSVNALTILQHGVPVDCYFGMPIYENTLTRPWPESAEYEFKDSSYSTRGLAVYHGWLPLYAIAASLALNGVRPDEVNAPTSEGIIVRHSLEDIQRRNWAARLPSVLFGVVFLCILYIAAERMYGYDAAWAALLLGAFAEASIGIATQARYYAATAAISTAVCFLIWLTAERGRWRDFLISGLLLALLFHTHVLTFIVACAVACLMAPIMLRHRHAWRKAAATVGIVALAVAPWAMWSGFIEMSSSVPKARSLLTLSDVLAYPRAKIHFVIFTGAGVAAALGATFAGHKLPPKFASAFSVSVRAIAMLAGWALLGFAAFTFLVPAASYFGIRTKLSILGPTILLIAVICGAIARTMAPRRSSLLAGGIVLTWMITAAMIPWWRAEVVSRESPITQVVEHLRKQEFRPGTKIYSTPNAHLILTYYTGFPIQSIAPVRKSFLDSYPHDVVIIESVCRYEMLTALQIQELAAKYGQPISVEKAASWEERLRSHLVRAELPSRVADVSPPAETLPPFLASTHTLQREHTERRIREELSRPYSNAPLFRGQHMPDWTYWWQTFFYRFCEPSRRTGDALNYVERIRNARARVLPSSFVIYVSPGQQAVP